MSEAIQKDGAPEELQTSFSSRIISVGDIVVGKIVKITGSVAFVDYGARSEGYIELSELRTKDGGLRVGEGDQIEAEVIGTKGAVQLSCKRAQTLQTLENLEKAFKGDQTVSGKVVGINKGGYEVRVEGVRAFCPTSQFSMGVLDEPKSQIGKIFDFKITEYQQGGKSLVVSRRGMLEAARDESLGQMMQTLKPGATVQGTVTQLRPFGAFVDLGGGVEGLVHVSEIAHNHVKHPSEKLNVGDAIAVIVLKIDADKGRIGLSIKQLEKDPWAEFTQTLKPGLALKGIVERLQPFGAFIQLKPGIDGLLHVSGISATQRIEHPSEVLEVGQEIDVVVDRVDVERKRIGLLTPEVAERRKPVELSFKKNDIVKGKVLRVEKFGVLITIGESGIEGLIPNRELNTDRDADHRRLFPEGSDIEAKVMEIDRGRNLRIRLSIRALKDHNEREAFASYKRSETQDNKGSMGSFGDLLKDFLK